MSLFRQRQTKKSARKTMEKYPFAPTTPLEDIVEYLRVSLTPVDETSEKPFESYENFWFKTHRFEQREYTVYMDVISNEYGFHVGEWNQYAPNKGIYDDWDAMIEGVARKFAGEWGISTN